MDTVIRESDRGAVLVATSTVDTFLQKLFEHAAPSNMRKKELDKLLRYPGPLHSLAAKTDIAFATRLIGRNAHSSIHLLRQIRNDVALSPDSFSIEEHRARIAELYELGPGVPSFINEMANGVLIQTFLERRMELYADRNPAEDRSTTPREILDRLSRSPITLAILQGKALRLELGLAVGLICALLVFHWEKAEARSTTDCELAVTRTGHT